MKKIASLVGAGAMLLGMAIPTFAQIPTWPIWPIQQNKAVVMNMGTVINDVDTKADSGDNSIGGWFGKVLWSDVTTGSATAKADIETGVNLNAISCNCYDDVSVSNFGTAMNDIYTKADSGDNSIGGWWVAGSNIKTGNAGASSLISSVVNSNIFGTGMTQ